MGKEFDYLVVGAGLYGVVFARMMTNQGKRCLIIDKRMHIAGNCYDEKIDAGRWHASYATFHKYGPHVFHTSNEKVWKFVNKYAKFNTFRLNVLAMDDDKKLYHLPFNMDTMYDVFKVTTAGEAKKIINKEIKEFGNIYGTDLESHAIANVGKTIYEKLIKGYTEKQWGRPCKELPMSIIRRLPIRFYYDNNYFDDKYQGVPINGYADMVLSIIQGAVGEDAIQYQLGVDYLDDIEHWHRLASNIIYCGSPDELFGYCKGVLEWRSLEFENHPYIFNYDNSNGVAQINFTSSNTLYTRVIDHIWFTPECVSDYINIEVPRTYERPIKWVKGIERYYPINDEKNSKVYNKYVNQIYEWNEYYDTKIYLGGRLGKYKYFDMDDTIIEAMNDVKTPDCR